jgi:putative membrane protein
MKVIIVENNKARINRVLDWLIYIFAYALILIVVSLISKSIYVDGSYYGLFGLLAAVIIYVLNKTIKPIIFLLTLPITAITLGIFYPFINILILKIVDFILGSHFDTHGIISLFFTAILISIMNVLMDVLVIKPILNRGGKL